MFSRFFGDNDKKKRFFGDRPPFLILTEAAVAGGRQVPYLQALPPRKKSSFGRIKKVMVPSCLHQIQDQERDAQHSTSYMALKRPKGLEVSSTITIPQLFLLLIDKPRRIVINQLLKLLKH